MNTKQIGALSAQFGKAPPADPYSIIDVLVEALNEARIFVGSIDGAGAKIAMRKIDQALAVAE